MRGTLAEKPVGWSYEVWRSMDRMVGDLSHRDGHKRASAAQILARLAISDPENRMRRDFVALAAVMKDEKTVTARHALQSIWRVGLAGPDRLALVLQALKGRFRECSSEKHASLVRTDVITSVGHLFRATGEPSIEAGAQSLIASEEDERARQKQRSSWKAAAGRPLNRHPVATGSRPTSPRRARP